MSRLDFLGLGLLLGSVLISLVGFTRIRSNTEDVLEWLPDKSAARDDLIQFESLFGSDDYLVITWEGCTVTDPRLQLLEQSIKTNDHEGLVQNVISGASVMQRLSRYRMSPAEIARRLKGVFFGCEQPTLTCLNVELSAIGAANRKKSMELVRTSIGQIPDLPADEVIMGGYPFIATTIDRQLINSQRYLLLPSVVLATLISLFCLRDAVLVGIVFLTAMSAAFLSLTIIPLTGVKFGGLMSIIPTLVFVLATSGCIHLIRYSQTVGSHPRSLLKIGWLPCTVSAATTIVGMLALTGSQFPAIRKFGLFCAVGVAIGLLFQLVLVPWLLYRIGQPGLARLAAKNSESQVWSQWFAWLNRKRFQCTFGSLIILVGGLTGLRYLYAEVEVENLFRPSSPVLSSLKRLEEQLGPLDQTELLVIFNGVGREDFDARVRLIKQIQQTVMRIEGVCFTHSLLNYLPNEPDARDIRSFTARSMYRGRLRSERENLNNRRNLMVTDDYEAWRISLRFPFTAKYDWADLGIQVRSAAQRVIDQSFGNAPPREKDQIGQSIQVIYTGRANLFQHAQRNLLQDLFQNFVLAFVVITPLLIIALRSFALGLLAMLPNLFPAAVFFGGLGWIGYPVDLAIAMTACIALGIAVDDTTHFLVRFRDCGGSWLNAATPIEQVIAQCGPAMVHTTLIACGGLLVYAVGEMLVVARFSVTISLLLVLALLADLIMMPSILLSLESLLKRIVKRKVLESSKNVA